MRGGCLFVSHGGGPMPLLGDPSHASMVKFSAVEVPEAKVWQ